MLPIMGPAVVYSATPTGFRVELHFIERYAEECFKGELLDTIWERARNKAVEFASERGVPLVRVLPDR